ncbi:unnamed protein product [Brachionus calyciflorus]|uniref:Uncharacterized protein n=1 Tax=Brachionus calyciflorus TaxID=104777 RepID=A0A814HWI3_9BILA|nr:unnamed protein product [Brachionus calyciflorus]
MNINDLLSHDLDRSSSSLKQLGIIQRTVYSYHPGLLYKLKNELNYEYNENDLKGVWLFEPVENRRNVYFLKNVYYKEYLNAGKQIKAFFFFQTNNRHVHTKNLKSRRDEEFMWRVESSENNVTYNIINLKYNEPLFADQKNYEEDTRRNIYTWKKKYNGLEFSWIIKCKNETFSNIFKN